MSLIEEALRRLGETPPTAAPEAPPRRWKEPAPASPTVHAPAAEPAPTFPPPAARAPMVTIGPWLGFWATIGGSVTLLVVGLLLGTLWNARPSSHTRPHASPASSVASVAVSQVTAAMKTPLVLEQPHALNRTATKPTLPRLELNGVVEGVGEPFVIINGQTVRLGETIEGATLVDVRDGVARFQWRDKELALRTAR